MKSFALIIITLFTVSCSSSKPSQTKINALEVTDKLVKGKTTQAQVLESFGAPDIVEKTSEGDMWAYNRQNNESNSTGGGVSNYISSAALWNFTGMHLGGDKSTSSTNSTSLIVYFNAKKVLRNYTFRTEKF